MAGRVVRDDIREEGKSISCRLQQFKISNLHLYELVFSYLGGKDSEEELLGHMVVLVLIF